VATAGSDATIKSALGAVMEAIRSAYGPTALRAAELADGGHDPTFLDRTAPLLEFLWSRYFRVRLLGVENVPATGAAMLVGNHSGGIPYDGALLLHGIHRDHPSHRRVRPLVANFAFRQGWMANVISRIGGVRASRETALPLLARGELVAVFPEGLRGVGKLYRERYRMARFGRGGFVRLSSEAQVPLLPVAIVGAEEIHPVIGKITSLAEPLGLPYIPITPTFPWLGPLGLLPVPTKWTIQIGAPIPPPAPGDGPGTVRVAEAVRTAIDGMIADLLVQRRSILFG
jgi:1-acyl-sn-glycerol-3-phosphate acyltransferase